jgi:hypothetical protein
MLFSPYHIEILIFLKLCYIRMGDSTKDVRSWDCPTLVMEIMEAPNGQGNVISGAFFTHSLFSNSCTTNDANPALVNHIPVFPSPT